MDEYAQFKATFFAECAELLAGLETGLSALEDGSADGECLNSIFRAAHSIKAGAGAFKFNELVEFSHIFEALLDGMRDGRVALTEEGVSLLFRANDILADLVTAAENETPVTPGYGADVAADLAAMAGMDAPAQDEDATAEGDAKTGTSLSTYRIRFEPYTELFQHANEPLLIIRELKSLGSVDVEIDTSRLPALAALDPESAFFAWTFLLKTTASREDVDEVFEFVVDDCKLEIELIDDGEAAGETVAAADSDVDSIDSAMSAQPGAEAPGGVGAVTPGNVAAAPAGGGAASKVSSIRVDLERIDRLVNMVGELVITQSMLTQQTRDLPTEQFPEVARGLDELALHTRELQESVMAIRMQPVKSVFTRMPRLVRDLSSKLNKKVKLRMSGENTEVDKTVIEEISDPITHMIRNSLDHGIESPEKRAKCGKPEEGEIVLAAEHRGGRIVITIADDGGGINRELVLDRARERGLVGPDEKLTDDEIDDLIFAPGFSTAAEVTDVSGRGVGMDVVRRNIQTLGGRVSIHSVPGKGTTFNMTLPLTLAVMDGMVLEVGSEKYVMPIANIVETIRPERKNVYRLPNGQELALVRGEYVGLVYLYRAFNIPGAVKHPSEGLVVLAETEHRGKVGIVVDVLLGQQQVVIKSLESNYDPVEGISAATILGNGMVAPILDPDGLRRMSGLPDKIQINEAAIQNEMDDEQDAAAAMPVDVLLEETGASTPSETGQSEQQSSMELG